MHVGFFFLVYAKITANTFKTHKSQSTGIAKADRCVAYLFIMEVALPSQTNTD